MSTITSNRIAEAIEKLAPKIEALKPETQASMDAEMALDFEEHFYYQETQAKAHALGLLTSEEAQTVYTALGEVGSQENGGWAEGTGVATKCAVTVVMLELLITLRSQR